MPECKDCIQVKSLEDKIASIWRVINELKVCNKANEDSIKELEIAKSEDRKDLERIFKSIEDIKDSLNKITTFMETMQAKSSKTFDNLKYETLKYVIIAVVAIIVAKLT